MDVKTILAVVLSVGVILAYTLLFAPDPLPLEEGAETQEQTQPQMPSLFGGRSQPAVPLADLAPSAVTAADSPRRPTPRRAGTGGGAFAEDPDPPGDRCLQDRVLADGWHHRVAPAQGPPGRQRRAGRAGPSPGRRYGVPDRRVRGRGYGAERRSFRVPASRRDDLGVQSRFRGHRRHAVPADQDLPVRPGVSVRVAHPYRELRERGAGARLRRCQLHARHRAAARTGL